MKILLSILCFLFIQAEVSYACINGESKIILNHYLFMDDEGSIPTGHEFMLADSSEILFSLDSAYKATDSIEYLSDMGYMYILMGHYQKAIDLYQSIEKKQPGLYSTSANMGTAYELIGDNENALKWIKRAVQISPTSHRGSEWIHVNILNTKICGESCISSQNLINTDFGTDKVPISNRSTAELDSLYQQIYYQAQERMSFIQPKNPILAQMLFDMGNISFLLNHRSDAIELYQDAEIYGFQDTSFLQERQEAVAITLPQELEDVDPNDKKSVLTVGSLFMILIGVFLLILAMMNRNDRKRKAQSS